MFSPNPPLTVRLDEGAGLGPRNQNQRDRSVLSRFHGSQSAAWAIRPGKLLASVGAILTNRSLPSARMCWRSTTRVARGSHIFLRMYALAREDLSD
jgi:hypothetical protein